MRSFELFPVGPKVGRGVVVVWRERLVRVKLAQPFPRPANTCDSQGGIPAVSCVILQEKARKTFQVVPSSLGFVGGGGRSHWPKLTLASRNCGTG